MTKKTKKRNANVCIKCPAYCCHDLAIPAKRPRTKHEIDTMLWQLHFDTVEVCICGKRWYIIVKGRCRYLNENNMCSIYEHRPQVCRDHSPENCEATGQWYDIKFSSPEALLAYLKK